MTFYVQLFRSQQLLSVMNDLGFVNMNPGEYVLTFSASVRELCLINDVACEDGEGNLVHGNESGLRNGDDI